MNTTTDALEGLLEFAGIIEERGGELEVENARHALALARAEPAGAQVCCGEYRTCNRACTPRGEWITANAGFVLPTPRSARLEKHHAHQALPPSAAPARSDVEHPVRAAQETPAGVDACGPGQAENKAPQEDTRNTDLEDGAVGKAVRSGVAVLKPWRFLQQQPSNTLLAVAPDGTQYVVPRGRMDSLAGMKLLNRMVEELSK